MSRSLASVCEAVGNDARVEILVSDNDSSDDTVEFVRAAQYHYSNIVRHKNASNIGANRNFLEIYRRARGKFVMACGDDDNLTIEAINRLIDIIEHDEDVSVVLMRNVKLDEFKELGGTGVVEYMRQASYWTTWISGIVFRKAALDEIDDWSRYDGTGLDQVYLQLRVLQNRPKFRILYGRILGKGSFQHEPYGFNYAEIFLKNYLEIVEAHAGLPREDMTREKMRLFNELLAPYFGAISRGRFNLSLDGVPEIFERFYKGEPYYDQASDILKRLGVLH